jgi:HEAT repeat protein
MTKRVTAGELRAQLEMDPDFATRRDAAAHALDAKADALRIAEAPLVSDLRATGYDISSVWDLVNTSRNYAQAIPLLVSHLARPYPSPIREGIARALGAPPAIDQWSVLLNCYKSENDLRVKDGLAAALSAIADDTVLDSLVALLRDPTNGESRLLLLRAFAKSRAPKAREVLMAFRSDPFFGTEATLLLQRPKRK